jgi:hypothetical protein
VIDVGRVQMWLFAPVAILVYFAACWHAFAVQAPDLLAFPPMSQSLVARLGISHATYLWRTSKTRTAGLKPMNGTWARITPERRTCNQRIQTGL